MTDPATTAAPRPGHDAGPAGSTDAAPDRRRAMSARETAVWVTVGVGLVLVLQLLVMGPAAPSSGFRNGAWHPPSSRAERLVAKMDGAAFAQTATDPFLRDTEADYGGDAVNASYRASRPFPGWVASVGSLGGQRVLLAPVLLALTALTIGWATYSVDVLGRALGVRARHLALVPLVPACVAAIAYPGIGEPLGLALSMVALACWFRHRPWEAVALFTAAALCRETMLLVPAGLAVWLVLHHRSLRPALPLLVPAAAYVAWVGLLVARFGEAPSAYSPPVAPLTGLLDGITRWHAAEWVTTAMLVAASVVIVRRGTAWMRSILVVNLLFSLTMGGIVWQVWWGYGRVLSILPLLALVAWARTEAPASDGDPAPTGGPLPA